MAVSKKTYVTHVLIRVLGKTEYDTILYKKFGLYLFEYKNEYYKEIRNSKKIMVIKNGLWANTYFIGACLHNTLNQVLYALSCGCIPVVELNKSSDTYYQWDWFFLQPAEYILGVNMEELTLKMHSAEYQVLDCDIACTEYMPSMQMVHDPESTDYRIWKFLYKEFVKINPKTLKYINDDLSKICSSLDGVLGVLVRGTDYLASKPAGHPIQPEIQEVVVSCENYMKKYGYNRLYIATEDRGLFEKISKSMEDTPVLENRRKYYDELYVLGHGIGEVHFDRDNDYYWKSIEYLSSLIILSQCSGIVAGNWGGVFSVLYSDGFEHSNIINKGLYT